MPVRAPQIEQRVEQRIGHAGQWRQISLQHSQLSLPWSSVTKRLSLKVKCLRSFLDWVSKKVRMQVHT